MLWIGVALSLVLIGFIFLEAAQKRRERLRELESIQRRLSEKEVSETDVGTVESIVRRFSEGDVSDLESDIRELESILRRSSESDVSAIDVDTVQYDTNHCEIVESGTDSIAAYFEKGSISEKRSLLLCLDWYLDPYYQHNLSHEDDVFSWLEREFYKAEDMKIKKEIYELVDRYSDLKLRGQDNDGRGIFVEKKAH